eukprot:7784432-Pyramimonas_sp.AAC.1
MLRVEPQFFLFPSHRASLSSSSLPASPSRRCDQWREGSGAARGSPSASRHLRAGDFVKPASH